MRSFQGSSSWPNGFVHGAAAASVEVRQSHEGAPGLTSKDYLAAQPVEHRATYRAVIAHSNKLGRVDIDPVRGGILLERARAFCELRPKRAWVELSFADFDAEVPEVSLVRGQPNPRAMGLQKRISSRRKDGRNRSRVHKSVVCRKPTLGCHPQMFLFQRTGLHVCEHRKRSETKQMVEISGTSLLDATNFQARIARMKTFEELVRLWAALPPAPRLRGIVRSICVRRGRGQHELPRSVEVSREHGVVGDRWSIANDPERLCQVTMMSASVAALVAHAEMPGHDAGDNFLVDLDLSEPELPVGARLRLGGVLCGVSAEPHTGCKKFRARFGDGALRWVNHEDNVHLRLRGLNLIVLESGHVQVGDVVEVLG